VHQESASNCETCQLEESTQNSTALRLLQSRDAWPHAGKRIYEFSFNKNRFTAWRMRNTTLKTGAVRSYYNLQGLRPTTLELVTQCLTSSPLSFETRTDIA
jgi:hypothetical protein